MRIALRFREGARVIQLASGCMPMISEWACWETWRVRDLRYASGIQSRGSMRESSAIRRSKFSWPAASSGDGTEARCWGELVCVMGITSR